MPERPTPNPDMVQHAADVQGMNLQFELLDRNEAPGAAGDVLTSQGDQTAPVWRMGTIGAADMISPGHNVKPGDVVVFSGKSGRTVETAGAPFTPDGIGADAAGTAQQLMDDHLADPSPHSQYMLASLLGSAALRDIGLGPQDVVVGSDPRLAPNRPPGSHAPSHGAGGTDPITPAMIGAAPFTHYHPTADANTNGFMSAADWTLLHNLNTMVPATATTLGGVIVGKGLQVQADGTISTDGAGGKEVIGNDQPFKATLAGDFTPIAVEPTALGMKVSLVVQTATGQLMCEVQAQRFNGAFSHVVSAETEVGTAPTVTFEVSENLGQMVLGMNSPVALTLIRGLYLWV